jgi:hypothetical protein
MTDPIALEISGLGIAMTFLMVAGAAAKQRQHRHAEGELMDWPVTAKKHIPYPTIGEDEFKQINSREDFVRTIILSAERQFAPQPKAYTPNQLKELLAKDLQRGAGDVLAPEEIEDAVSTAHHTIIDDWARAAARKKT